MSDTTVTRPDTPPADTESASLELPKTEPAQTPTEATLASVPDKAAELNLDQAQAKKLEQMVEAYVDAVTRLDPHEQARRMRAASEGPKSPCGGGPLEGRR